MTSWIRNFTRILTSPRDMIIGFVIAGFIAWIITHFTDRALVAGNYGPTHAQINRVLDIVNIILLGLFAASFSYKRFSFQTFDRNQGGWFGGILTAIVSGCPSCSITLATYLGLAGIISFLPFNGLEIKALGTLLILWSIYQNIKDLVSCVIRK